MVSMIQKFKYVLDSHKSIPLLIILNVLLSIYYLWDKGLYQQEPFFWDKTSLQALVTFSIISLIAALFTFFLKFEFVFIIFISTILINFFKEISFFSVLYVFLSAYCSGHILNLYLVKFYKKFSFENKEFQLLGFPFISKTMLGYAYFIFAMTLRSHFTLNQTFFTFLLTLPPVVVYIIKEFRNIKTRFTLALFKNFLTAGKNTGKLDRISSFSIYLTFTLFAFASHFPDVGWDSQAFHLAIPNFILVKGYWHYDALRMTTSLTNMGGDLLYAISNALAGEEGMKLTQFGFLVMIFILAYNFMKDQNYKNSLTPAALTICTPLFFLESRILFVDSIWTFFVVFSIIAYNKFKTSKNDYFLFLSVISAFTSLNIKTHSVLLIAILFIDFLYFDPKGFLKTFLLFLPFSIIGLFPYLYNFLTTGNPVFPFMNALFRSDLFHFENFNNARYNHPLTIKTLYQMSFNSSRFLESQNGSMGISLYIFFIPLLIRTWKDKLHIRLFAHSVLLFISIFFLQSYLRYLIPCFVVLCFLTGPLSNSEGEKYDSVFILAANIALLINISLFPTSTWERDWTFLKHQDEVVYLTHHSPEKILSKNIYREDPNSAVLYWQNPFWSNFPGTTYSNTWYNTPFAQKLQRATSTFEQFKIMKEHKVKYLIYRDENLKSERTRILVKDYCKLKDKLGLGIICELI